MAAGKESKRPNTWPVELKINYVRVILEETLAWISIHSPSTLTEIQVFMFWGVGCRGRYFPRNHLRLRRQQWEPGVLSTFGIFSLVFRHLACPRVLVLLQSTHLYLLFFLMANSPLPSSHPVQAGPGQREFRMPLGDILSHCCHPTELSATPSHAHIRKLSLFFPML